MKKEEAEKLIELVEQLFEMVGAPSMAERMEQTDRIEEAISQAIDEATPDEASSGTVIVALANVLAQHIVVNCIKEPPEVPSAMVSLAAANAGLKHTVEALTHFVRHAVRDAEANGATVVLRFRQPRPPSQPETNEDTPTEAAPGATTGVRDASGATEPTPPAYDRDRDNPLTDETNFGGTQASGTEG